MKFTGKNLLLVHEAVLRAIDNINDDIGRHPTPLEHPDDIEDLEKDRDKLEQMRGQIIRSLEK